MKRAVLALAGLGAVLAVWEGAPRLGWVSPSVLPPPSGLPLAFWRAYADGWLDAVRESLGQYLMGVGIGAGLGILLGFAVALSPRLEALLSGPMQVLRPVPALAWVPVGILWFGFTGPAVIFVVAIGVFGANAPAACGAVQAVDRELVEMAEAYGQGGRWSTAAKVLLPGAAAGILVGIRAGLAQGWLAVVGAGLAGIPGLGQRMEQAASGHAADAVLVYLITFMALFGLTDALWVLVRDRLSAWQR